MSIPDLNHLESLMAEWESLSEMERSGWLQRLRDSNEEDWKVFVRMSGGRENTRIESMSRRLWQSLDLEAGRVGDSVHQYIIRNVVDGGGMGVVYQAWDQRLNRMVALKFLSQHERHEGDALDRFMREARASAALDHPNICGIFEVERAEDGSPFFAMPWYDGHTVAELLEHGPLSIDLARSILRQTALGLQHAHQHGLIHCDIKPGNLFVTTEGRLKILDFGIVQLAGLHQEESSGPTMGTLPYMSPEQLDGKRCTELSDLWSLGVVAFEMAAGTKPFAGANRTHIVESIASGPPPLPKTVPLPYARITEQLLKQNPDDRPLKAETVVDMLDDQPTNHAWRWMTATVAILLMLLWMFGPWKSGEGTTQVVEVAPFQIESPRIDSGLVAGMYESVIQRAGHLPGISVRKAAREPLQTDATEGAHWLFSGRFVEDGEMDEVVMLLIDRVTGEQVSTITLPIEPGAWVGLDTDIVGVLEEQLERERQLDHEVASQLPEQVDPLAFEHYLRGLGLMSLRTPGSIVQASSEFDQATAHDPDFAAAFASLGEALALSAGTGYAPQQGTTVMMQAEAAVDRALDLDSTNARAHFTKGFILHEHHWNWSEASGHFETAIRLNPSNAEAHHLYATHLAELGDLDSALQIQNRARTLSPGTPIYHANYAQLLFLDRRYTEVLSFLDRLDSILSNFYIARIWMAWSLLELGREDDAALAIAKLRSDLGPQPLVVCLEGLLLARQGYREASVETADQIARTSPTLAAAVHIEHGNTERAMDLLEEGLNMRDVYLTIIGVWPGADPVRSDPRFISVLERMNLGGD